MADSHEVQRRDFVNLVLVGRDQKILWMANPMSSIDTAIADLTKVADADGSPTGNYPKKVINRIVDRWVN